MPFLLKVSCLAFIIIILPVLAESQTYLYADQGMAQSSSKASNEEPVSQPSFRTSNGSVVMPKFPKSLLQLNASWDKKKREEELKNSDEKPRYAGKHNNPYAWGVGMPPSASDGPVEFTGPIVVKK